MKGRKFLSVIATTFAVMGMAIGNINSKAEAQQVLESTKTISGRIDSGSTPVGVPGRGFHPGVEYTFEANVGDYVNITAIREEGSSIDVMLVVIPPNISPPAPIDKDLDGGQRETFEQKSINAGGTWKVRVVSYNDKPGNYQLSFLLKRNDQIVQPEVPLPLADRVMKKLNLTATACSSPDLVAVIQIGGETRCTTGYPKGEYVYEQASNTLIAKQPADSNLALIKTWGLNTTACGGSVVSIMIDGKQYCASPTNWLNVGEYTYNRAADRLDPLNQNPPVNPEPPVNPQPPVNLDDGGF